tara:strand:+ start:162 stop:296 length:135 start_codon:yes stop_codon:yes gene_type:complete
MVCFDTQFSRYRADDFIIVSYTSLYVVTCLDGKWGMQARSIYGL